MYIHWKLLSGIIKLNRGHFHILFTVMAAQR